MPARKIPQPPAHLRPATADWWRSVMADFDLEAHHVLLLTAAAEALDRATEARGLLAAEGLTVPTGNGGCKPHPAAGIERDNKTLFARLLRELDLDVGGPAPDARPPALRSNRRL